MPRRPPVGAGRLGADRRRTAHATLALTVCALLAAGCGRTVAIEPPPSSDPACAAFLASLPDVLDGERRRDVDDPAAGAAWGAPPLIVRCGVPKPAALDATSPLIDVNGVAWLPERLERGTLFTSVDTSPRVEFTVPAEQEPAGRALVELSAVLDEAVLP